MAANEEFGELLIEALEEAVAYKQGKRPGLRRTRFEITIVEMPSPRLDEQSRAGRE